MKRYWQRRRDVLPSEKGFLAFAGSEPGLPLREALIKFRALIDADMAWTSSRKARFRWRAAALQIAVLSLTAGSTIVLGIPTIPNRASVALPLVAAVTLLSGLESFFAWR